MTGSKDLHKGEVATRLDLTPLLAILKLQITELDLVEGLLTGPLESLGPGVVSEPVADEVGITSVDKDWDLFQDTGDEAVEWLHPVALEQEVAVDVKVAAVVAGDFGADSSLDGLIVQPIADPSKSGVAEVAIVLTLASDIVDVLENLISTKLMTVNVTSAYLASPLIRTNHGVVTVDASRYAGPDTLAVVAVLDQALASRKSVVHSLTLALAQDGRPSSITASHGPVVLVLSQTISQTVSDQDRLEVDVAVLVRKDLGGENGDVVTGVRLSGDVEVLLRVFGELREEKGHQGVNILAGCDSVANRATAVRVSDVDRLVEEDDGGICVPRVGVVVKLEVLVDTGRTKLEEQTGQRRASRSAVEPENHGVVLGVISGFEEP